LKEMIMDALLLINNLGSKHNTCKVLSPKFSSARTGENC